MPFHSRWRLSDVSSLCVCVCVCAASAAVIVISPTYPFIIVIMIVMSSVVVTLCLAQNERLVEYAISTSSPSFR